MDVDSASLVDWGGGAVGVYVATRVLALATSMVTAVTGYLRARVESAERTSAAWVSIASSVSDALSRDRRAGPTPPTG